MYLVKNNIYVSLPIPRQARIGTNLDHITKNVDKWSSERDSLLENYHHLENTLKLFVILPRLSESLSFRDILKDDFCEDYDFKRLQIK